MSHLPSLCFDPSSNSSLISDQFQLHLSINPVHCRQSSQQNTRKPPDKKHATIARDLSSTLVLVCVSRLSCVGGRGDRWLRVSKHACTREPRLLGTAVLGRFVQTRTLHRRCRDMVSFQPSRTSQGVPSHV